jgi:hypothetical protein
MAAQLTPQSGGEMSTPMTREAEWLDGDGYPTEAALTRIEQWPLEDANGVLDFIKSLWWMADWGVAGTLSAAEAEIVHAEPEDRFLRLATGGWSGNESLIDALDRHLILSAFLWCLSTRGGLHIYRYASWGEGGHV